MRIIFSPQQRPDAFAYAVSGETIIAGGVSHDLSPLAEGDILPADALDEDWFLGAERTGGEVWVRVLHAYEGGGTAADRFPAPVAVTSGPVPAPVEA